MGGYFQSGNYLLFKANFCDFCVCVCVCSRYLVSGGDPLHAGVWSPSLPGNQRQRDSGHDFGLSLLHS